MVRSPTVPRCRRETDGAAAARPAVIRLDMVAGTLRSSGPGDIVINEVFVDRSKKV
ncbi:hypothetical protein [Pseudonocardia sediminis]|uniref:hypothetical protein n=1 Tax=Pseudonocardia sediminis TaxID=1397368 RepID=UPI001F5FDAE8|nr:hypothetical protein [Pseudonocardia sediminis]